MYVCVCSYLKPFHSTDSKGNERRIHDDSELLRRGRTKIRATTSGFHSPRGLCAQGPLGELAHTRPHTSRLPSSHPHPHPQHTRRAKTPRPYNQHHPKTFAPGFTDPAPPIRSLYGCDELHYEAQRQARQVLRPKTGTGKYPISISRVRYRNIKFHLHLHLHLHRHLHRHFHQALFLRMRKKPTEDMMKPMFVQAEVHNDLPVHSARSAGMGNLAIFWVR